MAPPEQSNEDRIRGDAKWQADEDIREIGEWYNGGKLTLIDEKKAEERIEKHVRGFIRDKLHGIDPNGSECNDLVALFKSHYGNCFKAEIVRCKIEIRCISDEEELRLCAMAMKDRKNQHNENQIRIAAAIRSADVFGKSSDRAIHSITAIEESVEKYKEYRSISQEVEWWPERPTFLNNV